MRSEDMGEGVLYVLGGLRVHGAFCSLGLWKIGYVRRFFVEIGCCGVFGQSEGRMGRWWMWGFKSAHEVVAGNGLKSSGY